MINTLLRAWVNYFFQNKIFQDTCSASEYVTIYDILQNELNVMTVTTVSHMKIFIFHTHVPNKEQKDRKIVKYSSD